MLRRKHDFLLVAENNREVRESTLRESGAASAANEALRGKRGGVHLWRCRGRDAARGAVAAARARAADDGLADRRRRGRPVPPLSKVCAICRSVPPLPEVVWGYSSVSVEARTRAERWEGEQIVDSKTVEPPSKDAARI